MRISDWSSDVCSSDLQVVIAKLQLRLCFVALIAQVAHAQAGGVGQIQGSGVERLQMLLRALKKAFRYGGRGAKQVHQQPRVAREIAYLRDRKSTRLNSSH